MPYYRANFPDPGAGRKRFHCFIEATSEEDARRLAAGHDHFENWNTDAGTIKPTDIRGRQELRQKVRDVTSPNSAVLADGTLVRRDIENGGVYEQQSA